MIEGEPGGFHLPRPAGDVGWQGAGEFACARGQGCIERGLAVVGVDFDDALVDEDAECVMVRAAEEGFDAVDGEDAVVVQGDGVDRVGAAEFDGSGAFGDGEFEFEGIVVEPFREGDFGTAELFEFGDGLLAEEVVGRQAQDARHDHDGVPALRFGVLRAAPDPEDGAAFVIR